MNFVALCAEEISRRLVGLKAAERHLVMQDAFNPNGAATEQVASRLLTRDEVAALYGIGKRYLEQAAARREGPPIVRISPRMVRYRVRDLEAWIESRIERNEEDEG